MLRSVVLVVASIILVVSCADIDAVDEASAAATPREWIDDPDCDEETIGDDDGSVAAAFVVEDQVVVGVCAGEPDERLDRAWEELTAIVPVDQLSDLRVFAGFDDPGSDVLAFATLLGDSNDRFAVVVNLPLAVDDADELRLTLAHEMSHVFSQTPDQLDVDVEPADCPTVHNGNGCFLDGALVLDWIDRFWSDEQLASIPDPAEADEAGAPDRCSLDPGFLGSYAASSPEEDFAESFSAYVFDLDVPVEVQPRLDFFAQRPEFDAYRELARTDERGPPVGDFEECGV